jgi:hypothetical protein
MLERLQKKTRWRMGFSILSSKAFVQRRLIFGNQPSPYPSYLLSAAWSVRDLRCMGGSDRAVVVQIVAIMVG